MNLEGLLSSAFLKKNVSQKRQNLKFFFKSRVWIPLKIFRTLPKNELDSAILMGSIIIIDTTVKNGKVLKPLM